MPSSTVQLSPTVEDALKLLCHNNPRGAFLGQRIAQLVDQLEEDVYQALERLEEQGAVHRIHPMRETASQSRWSLR